MKAYDLCVRVRTSPPKGAYVPFVPQASKKPYVPDAEPVRKPEVGRNTRDLLCDETLTRVSRLNEDAIKTRSRCCVCGVEQFVEEFYSDSSRSTGISSTCKRCKSKAAAARYRSKKAVANGAQGDPATAVGDAVHETEPKPSLIGHGLSGYAKGCRCPRCKAANTEKGRRYRGGLRARGAA